MYLFDATSPPPLQTHKKVYGSLEEELQRHTTWQSNKKYIDEHNQHVDVHGFTLSMNEYGDMVRININSVFVFAIMDPLSVWLSVYSQRSIIFFILNFIFLHVSVFQQIKVTFFALM